jgi:predicted AAA+ superfamily ATPase
MFNRDLKEKLIYASKKFPVLTITGPRQSGKTTLIKSAFPDKDYVSLEDLDMREFAINDPRTFLNTYKNGAIIDEAQHSPDLFSFIQTKVDNDKKMGAYILTGSQNILLSEKISQSLAGRTAVLQLLPCQKHECAPDISDVNELIFKGLYPAIYDRDIEPNLYYSSYLSTYVERDLRTMLNVKDLSKFHLFLKLCAGRIGQLLNISSLGNECGINDMTARAWISILEASYILFLLRPYHKNYNKRIVKQPKLYFYDTGLAAHLLSINSPQTLATHYLKGQMFENFVALELLKSRLNQGLNSNIYFWRDNHGQEIDFILENSNNLSGIEAKSSATITESFFKGLKYWHTLDSENSNLYLIYSGDLQYKRHNINIAPWTKVYELNKNI